MFNPYAKAVILSVVAAFGVLATSLDDGRITASDVVLAVAAFVGGFAAVWASPMFKWVLGAVVAGLTSVAAALLEGGISTQEAITIGSAVVAALAAVYIQPNTVAGNLPNPASDTTVTVNK